MELAWGNKDKYENAEILTKNDANVIFELFSHGLLKDFKNVFSWFGRLICFKHIVFTQNYTI